MKTVTKTALANLKLHRGRNLISGFAILLTTLLIFFTITIGMAAGSVELAAVNVYYPTYHAMFRGVTEENVQRLESQNEIETMGLREDFAYGVDDDADIGFYAMDEEGIRLSKIELVIIENDARNAATSLGSRSRYLFSLFILQISFTILKPL